MSIAWHIEFAFGLVVVFSRYLLARPPDVMTILYSNHRCSEPPGFGLRRDLRGCGCYCESLSLAGYAACGFDVNRMQGVTNVDGPTSEDITTERETIPPKSLAVGFKPRALPILVLEHAPTRPGERPKAWRQACLYQSGVSVRDHALIRPLDDGIGPRVAKLAGTPRYTHRLPSFSQLPRASRV